MKKLLLAIILIFSLSFFCGCQKSSEASIGDDYILLSLSQNANLTITQSVQFSLNSKYINENAKSLKEEVEFKRNLTKNLTELRNEFLISFALVYVASPNEEFKINKGVVLTDVSINEESDTIGFEIYFTSPQAWDYYHPSKKETQEPQNKKNIFYSKSESRGLFPFSSTIKSADGEKLSGEIYKNRYLVAAKGLSFEDKLKEDYNVQFIYSYSTPSQRMRSDANIIFSQNRISHHIRVVDEQNLSNENSITVSSCVIYYGWWLFFAILVPLVICGTSILIITLSRKRKIKLGEKK